MDVKWTNGSVGHQTQGSPPAASPMWRSRVRSWRAARLGLSRQPPRLLQREKQRWARSRRTQHQEQPPRWSCARWTSLTERSASLTRSYGCTSTLHFRLRGRAHHGTIERNVREHTSCTDFERESNKFRISTLQNIYRKTGHQSSL